MVLRMLNIVVVIFNNLVEMDISLRWYFQSNLLVLGFFDVIDSEGAHKTFKG